MKRIWTTGREKHGPLSALLFAAFAAASILLFIPAAGATNIVQLQSPAYPRSHGAAVQVTVTIACTTRKSSTVAASSTPTRATLTVKLVETVGGATAVGTGKATSKNGDFRCDGGTHNIQVYVLARTKAFVRGTAFGQATLQVCNATCRSVTDARSIKIT